MRCVSIRQPWLDLVLCFTKRIENRTYSVKPGPILLHASRTKPKQEHLVEIFDVFGVELNEGFELSPDLFPYGVIAGAAVVTECFEFDRETELTEAALEADETLWWAEGPVCWRLDEVVRLKKSLPWKGAAGIFHVPDDEVRPLLPKRWSKNWMP